MGRHHSDKKGWVSPDETAEEQQHRGGAGVQQKNSRKTGNDGRGAARDTTHPDDFEAVPEENPLHLSQEAPIKPYQQNFEPKLKAQGKNGRETVTGHKFVQDNEQPKQEMRAELKESGGEQSSSAAVCNNDLLPCTDTLEETEPNVHEDPESRSSVLSWNADKATFLANSWVRSTTEPITAGEKEGLQPAGGALQQNDRSPMASAADSSVWDATV